MLSAAPGSPGLSSDNIQAWDVSLSDTKRGSQKIGACGELTCSRSPFLVSLNVGYGDVPCRLPTVLRIRTSYHRTSDSMMISISCPSVRAPTARHPKSERYLDPEGAFATDTLCTCARVHVCTHQARVHVCTSTRLHASCIMCMTIVRDACLRSVSSSQESSCQSPPGLAIRNCLEISLV